MPLDRVLDAAQRWAARLRAERPEVTRVGYFGSYARGDYVPGSDFDVIIELVDGSPAAQMPRLADRSAEYYPAGFPVPVQIVAYTTAELTALHADGSRFVRMLDAEARWLT